MNPIRNAWQPALRRVCDSQRGTVTCEVVATGEPCRIVYDYGLRICRDRDGKTRELPADLERLQVSEEIAERLADIAAQIAREKEIDSAVALLRFEQKMARKANRWQDGTYRTCGSVERSAR